MNADSVITIYGNEGCAYCSAARMLLARKGVKFQDLIVSGDADRFAEMQQRSGRRTVPQIFVGDYHVGGFDDLTALDKSGELDTLLAES